MDAKRRRAIYARKTISCLQYLLPSMGETQGRSNTNLVQRGKLIKMCVDMGLTKPSNRFHWCKALRLKLQRKNNKKRSLGVNYGRKKCKSIAVPLKRRKGSVSESGIDRRVNALKRLVPGGSALGLERLFEETADYIMALEGQVTAMKAVARFFESFNLKMNGRIEQCEAMTYQHL